MTLLEIDQLKESKEYKAMTTLTDAMNTFSWNPEAFAKSVTLEHRTLQQELMRTIVAVIKELSDTNYDDRNKATVDLCKKIVESGVLDNSYLPII
jgi:hypothetical protein